MPVRPYDATWRGMTHTLGQILDKAWASEAKILAIPIGVIRYFVRLWKDIEDEYLRQGRASQMTVHRRARNAGEVVWLKICQHLGKSWLTGDWLSSSRRVQQREVRTMHLELQTTNGVQEIERNRQSHHKSSSLTRLLSLCPPSYNHETAQFAPQRAKANRSQLPLLPNYPNYTTPTFQQTPSTYQQSPTMQVTSNLPGMYSPRPPTNVIDVESPQARLHFRISTTDEFDLVDLSAPTGQSTSHVCPCWPGVPSRRRYSRQKAKMWQGFSSITT